MKKDMTLAQFLTILVAACPHGEILSDPSDLLDILLNITENILQQAG